MVFVKRMRKWHNLISVEIKACFLGKDHSHPFSGNDWLESCSYRFVWTVECRQYKGDASVVDEQVGFVKEKGIASNLPYFITTTSNKQGQGQRFGSKYLISSLIFFFFFHVSMKKFNQLVPQKMNK